MTDVHIDITSTRPTRPYKVMTTYLEHEKWNKTYLRFMGKDYVCVNDLYARMFPGVPISTADILAPTLGDSDNVLARQFLRPLYAENDDDAPVFLPMGIARRAMIKYLPEKLDEKEALDAIKALDFDFFDYVHKKCKLQVMEKKFESFGEKRKRLASEVDKAEKKRAQKKPRRSYCL